MAGIISYGAYIPYSRLSRELIARAWGNPPVPGEKAVANADEDSVTMAVESSFDCLKGIDRAKVNGLYFCSTTSPYKEKQCSSIVAAAVDLGDNIATADFANSLRGGTSAVRSALDSVKANPDQKFLVCAADCRSGTPHSADEQNFGDAAAAVLVGDGPDVIATIEDSLSVSDEITDVWRREEDRFVQSWEDRWVIQYGYTKNVEAACRSIMEKNGLTPADFGRAVIYGPDARSHTALVKSLGFDPKTQVQDPLLTYVGNSGCAHPLLMLVAALEQAKPGDRLLWASYGSGSDAFVLRVTEAVSRLAKRRGLKGFLSPKRMLPSYEKYLAFRSIIAVPEEFIRLFPSATAMWRTRDWVVRCHGSRCRQCGTTHFPIQRVCYTCQSKDDFDEVRLSDKKGKVFTYSLD
ncbi:MAG: 3-oxoacyl-[acyl-carrier-protein] synthase III C-terminal domain-containing protein, partial [Dehalococcoidia bacterium]|nr:3-oxoacyl-[acyl-carrier-protein] synthase III C-terminal domain-containing protein [Dehalococcoidia bacterium]